MSTKSRKSSNADLYLEIAADAVGKLRKSPRPVVVGSRPSEHFRHALVVSVFSAFAVEYALTELVWVKCFLQVPKSHRQMGLICASKLHSIPDKLEFVRSTTSVPTDILEQVKKLLEYRNRIAHCRVRTFEGKVLDPDSLELLLRKGEGSQLDEPIELSLKVKRGGLKAIADEFGRETRYVELEGFGTEALEAALGHFETARKALVALRRAWKPSPR